MLLCSAESDSEEVVVSSSNIDHQKSHGRCSNPTIIIIIIITSPTEGVETQQLSFNNKIPLFHLNTHCFKANWWDVDDFEKLGSSVSLWVFLVFFNNVIPMGPPCGNLSYKAS